MDEADRGGRLVIVNRTAKDELLAIARMIHGAETWEDLAEKWPRAIDAIGRFLKILEKRRLHFKSGELSDQQMKRLKGIYLGVLPKLAFLRWQFTGQFKDEQWAIDESWILGPLVMKWWHEERPLFEELYRKNMKRS